MSKIKDLINKKPSELQKMLNTKREELRSLRSSLAQTNNDAKAIRETRRQIARIMTILNKTASEAVQSS